MKLALLVVALSGCSFLAVSSSPRIETSTRASCASFAFPVADTLAVVPIEALALGAALRQGFSGDSQGGPIVLALFGGVELVSAVYGFVAGASCRKKLD